MLSVIKKNERSLAVNTGYSIIVRICGITVGSCTVRKNRSCRYDIFSFRISFLGFLWNHIAMNIIIIDCSSWSCCTLFEIKIELVWAWDALNSIIEGCIFSAEWSIRIIYLARSSYKNSSDVVIVCDPMSAL